MLINKKEMTAKLIILVGLIAFISTNAIQAQSPEENPGMKRPGQFGDNAGMRRPGGQFKDNMEQQMDKMMEQLGTTPEQREKLKTIKEQAKTKLEPLAKEMAQKRKELMDFAVSPQAKKEEILSKNKELNNLHEKISETHIRACSG